MANAALWPLPDPITELAARYGHPPPWQDQNPAFDHGALIGIQPLQSGLTPLVESVYAADPGWYDELSWNQRERFSGMTTDEFDKLEAFGPTSKIEPALKLPDRPLHPLLERSRWCNDTSNKLPLHWALYPMRNGYDGYWEASNPVVWEAMMPSLRLASTFLYKHETQLWWASMLLSPRTELDHSLIDTTDPKYNQKFHYFQFRALDPQLANTTAIQQQVRELLVEVGKKIELHIHCSSIESNGGAKHAYPSLGATFTYGAEEQTWVGISYELIEGIMTPGITPAELMLGRLKLANTILHELSHAVAEELNFKLLGANRPTFGTYPEPYFEDELIAELGFSLENALFGGLEGSHPAGSYIPMKGHPLAVIYNIDWNSKQNTRLSLHAPMRDSTSVSGWEYNDQYPIPVNYFFDLHVTDYWDCYVSKYGPTSTHMGPKLLGLRIFPDPTRPKETIRKLGLSHSILPNPSMKPADIASLIVENSRCRQANRIFDRFIGARPYRKPTSMNNNPGGQYRETAPPRCPRFREIRAYLFSKRKELALDTMHFKIPEHVLYSYILREGGISLTWQVFRQFLLLCDWNRSLFRYEHIGAPPSSTEGIVQRIPDGWPTTPLTPDYYPLPSDMELDMFFAGVNATLQLYVWGGFDEHFDFDSEILRKFANREIQKRQFVNKRGKWWMGAGLSERRWEGCVAESSKRGFWSFGPKGIIRRGKILEQGSSDNGSISQQGNVDPGASSGRKMRKWKDKQGPKNLKGRSSLNYGSV